MIKLYIHKSGKYALVHTTREGRATIIVPVVMARADTVMNGARIPEDQFHPQSWNGVPVTVQHPKSKFGSANDPDTLAKWAVGTIFNASYVDGVLKGEAWVDVQKANKIAPGLIDALNNGETMDVSTGYFASDVESSGTLNGKAYQIEHHDLKPDHLALLPGVEGACNWQDGCGVRANKGTLMKPRELLLALAKALNVNLGETAGKKDRKAVVAALIANEKSPFTDEDAAALEALSEASLDATVNAYGDKPDGATEPDKDDEAMGNSDDAAAAAAAAAAVVAASAKPGKKIMVQNCGCGGKPHTMSAEDKEAIEFGKKSLAAHKASLVAKVVENTTHKKEDAEKMSVEVLETIVNGLKPVEAGSFGARPAVSVTKANDDTKKMVSSGVAGVIRNAAKKKEAA